MYIHRVAGQGQDGWQTIERLFIIIIAYDYNVLLCTYVQGL